MNFGTFLGFATALAAFIITIMMSFKNILVVFDLHAAVIVIGGTVAVALICFPLGKIAALLKVFFAVYSDATKKTTTL